MFWPRFSERVTCLLNSSCLLKIFSAFRHGLSLMSSMIMLVTSYSGCLLKDMIVARTVPPLRAALWVSSQLLGSRGGPSLLCHAVGSPSKLLCAGRPLPRPWGDSGLPARHTARGSHPQRRASTGLPQLVRPERRRRRHQDRLPGGPSHPLPAGPSGSQLQRQEEPGVSRRQQIRLDVRRGDEWGLVEVLFHGHPRWFRFREAWQDTEDLRAERVCVPLVGDIPDGGERVHWLGEDSSSPYQH